jgi:hypothetical protein
MKYLRIISSGLFLLILGVFLERSCFFLYSGYAFVRVAGVAVAMVFVYWAIRLYRSADYGPSIVTLAIAGIIVVAGFVAKNLDSSPRKHFYILADAIKSGDSFEAVARKMSQYESSSTGDGVVSFLFASHPGTADVVIVRYDSKTKKVLGSEISLD